MLQCGLFNGGESISLSRTICAKRPVPKKATFRSVTLINCILPTILLSHNPTNLSEGDLYQLFFAFFVFFDFENFAVLRVDVVGK